MGGQIRDPRFLTRDIWGHLGTLTELLGNRGTNLAPNLPPGDVWGHSVALGDTHGARCCG